MEDVRQVFTAYANRTQPLCSETRATFARGVTCKDLMADGSCFKSEARSFSLTFLETGSRSRTVSVNLASDSGLETSTCML